MCTIMDIQGKQLLGVESTVPSLRWFPGSQWHVPLSCYWSIASTCVPTHVQYWSWIILGYYASLVIQNILSMFIVPCLSWGILSIPGYRSHKCSLLILGYLSVFVLDSPGILRLPGYPGHPQYVYWSLLLLWYPECPGTHYLGISWIFLDITGTTALPCILSIMGYLGWVVAHLTILPWYPTFPLVNLGQYSQCLQSQNTKYPRIPRTM